MRGRDVLERVYFGEAYGHPPRAMPCHSGRCLGCSGLPRASHRDATETELKRLRFAAVGSAPETEVRACVAHHQTQIDLTVSGESLRFSSVPRDLFPSNGEGQTGRQAQQRQRTPINPPLLAEGAAQKLSLMLFPIHFHESRPAVVFILQTLDETHGPLGGIWTGIWTGSECMRIARAKTTSS